MIFRRSLLGFSSSSSSVISGIFWKLFHGNFTQLSSLLYTSQSVLNLSSNQWLNWILESLNPCNFRSNYLSDAMWYVTTSFHMYLSNRMGGDFRLRDFFQPKNCKVLYSGGRYPVKVSACHDGDWSRLDCVGTLCGSIPYTLLQI